MDDFSLVDKLKILMNLIASSPLFLFCSMMGISLLIFYIICIKNNKNINKWIFVIVWVFLALLLIINYNQVVFKIIDNLLDEIFMILYFPSISVYIIVLLLSNILFLYSLFNKTMDKNHKIINILNVLILDFLLIPIVDTINANNIDIYNTTTIYSNSNLLVLMQLSIAFFVSWLLLNLLFTAHNKLKKYDVVKKKELPEIIFEEI